jgi:hypothetical protein
MANKRYHPQPDARFIEASRAASRSSNAALKSASDSARDTRLLAESAAYRKYRQDLEALEKRYRDEIKALGAQSATKVAAAKNDHAAARKLRLEITERYRASGDAETAAQELAAIT